MEINPSRKVMSINEHMKERIRDKLYGKLDRVLQRIFEYGFDNNAPKWYWFAVRDTLINADKIIRYNPSRITEELYLNTVTINKDDEYNSEIFVSNELELDELDGKLDDDLKDEPIITLCWKLLDMFYDKLDNDNLENIKTGLLLELDKSFLKYNNEY